MSIVLHPQDLARQDVTIAGPPGAWLSLDASISNRFVHAYVKGGTIWVGTADVTLSFVERDTGIVGTRPCVRYDRHSQDQRIYLAYEHAGGIKAQSTIDEGRNWSSVDTIASDGTFPTVTIPPGSGTRYHYRVVSGAIKGVIQDRTGTVIVSDFTAVSSGVDEDAITARDFIANQGQLIILLEYRSSGDIVTKTAPDGKTFS